MLISFQGKLTKSELTRIFALALKNQRWLTYVFGPFFLLFTWALITSLIKGYDLFNFFWVMAMVFTGILSTFPFWAPQMNAKNALKNQAEMISALLGSISEEEIILQSENATQTIKWTLYKKVLRNENQVLLYISSRCFNFYPRSFFQSDEDWQSLNRMIDEKVRKGDLKEPKDKFDLTFGTRLPRWAMILIIVLVALPMSCFIFAMVINLVVHAGQ